MGKGEGETCHFCDFVRATQQVNQHVQGIVRQCQSCHTCFHLHNQCGVLSALTQCPPPGVLTVNEAKIIEKPTTIVENKLSVHLRAFQG